MIRPVLVFAVLSLCVSVSFGQADSTRRTTAEPSSHPPVSIPGIDTPMSGPGTMLQSSTNQDAVIVPEKKGKKRRLQTSPPSDPRAFGVSVPLEGNKKVKRDTLNR